MERRRDEEGRRRGRGGEDGTAEPSPRPSSSPGCLIIPCRTLRSEPAKQEDVGRSRYPRRGGADGAWRGMEKGGEGVIGRGGGVGERYILTKEKIGDAVNVAWSRTVPSYLPCPPPQLIPDACAPFLLVLRFSPTILYHL